MMSKLNLNNCDREPIHIPGKIQPHGFLIALDDTLKICYCSNNIIDFTGLDVTCFLDKDIECLQSVNGLEHLAIKSKVQLPLKQESIDDSNAYSIKIENKPYTLIINTSEKGITLLDFEPELSDLQTELQYLIGKSLSKILSDKNLDQLLRNATYQIKQIIGYDRVMIYKFHEDAHGEVVAESKSDNIESWLGLHYPASDIPVQARELYKKNLVRLIANVNDEPSVLVTTSSNKKDTLDLTNSSLRAVSPVHIQYLKNMGVFSSFSVSIIDNGKLWGLIACHNYTPRFINFGQREGAKLIGQVLSSAISFRQHEEDQLQEAKHRQSLEKITRSLMRNIPIIEALTGNEYTLSSILESGGSVFCYEDNLYPLENIPDKVFINKLLKWLDKKTLETGYYVSNKLSEDFPEAIQYRSVASGLLACRLSRDLQEYLIWFRPEVVNTVKWAGNPEKNIEIDSSGFTHISPRHSFQEWKQVVELTSEPWTKHDIGAALALKDEINFAISRKATELRIINTKLRQAYSELNAFSYTISHDLKNPLTTIKSYAQLISRNKECTDNLRNMADRIQTGTVKMQYMIDEILNYSKVGQSRLQLKEIDMQKLLSEIQHDLLISNDNKNLRIKLGNTPEIKGDELMVFQVFSNLISNAVKYSAKQVAPVVEIFGDEQKEYITYTVADNGIGINITDHTKIFDLFSRSDSGKDFEGTGVGLAIVKRILEKHDGRIWLDSIPGIGSKFYVSFKKQYVD